MWTLWELDFQRGQLKGGYAHTFVSLPSGVCPGSHSEDWRKIPFLTILKHITAFCPSLQGLPCDLSSLMDPRRVVDFQFRFLLGMTE